MYSEAKEDRGILEVATWGLFRMGQVSWNKLGIPDGNSLSKGVEEREYKGFMHTNVTGWIVGLGIALQLERQTGDRPERVLYTNPAHFNSILRQQGATESFWAEVSAEEGVF